MRYNTILFDLDGTLLDTTSGVIDAVKITLTEEKLEMPSEEKLKTFVGPPMQDTLKKYYGFDDENALSVANKFRANYKKYSLFQAELYDGVEDLLSFLKNNNFKLAVATNKSHENAMLILEKFGITQYLDYAQGSDLEGKLKKSDIALSCLKYLSSSNDEAILVGDSTSDSNGALKANIDFLAVLYGFGFKNLEDLTNVKNVGVCENISDIKKFFKEDLCLKN